LKVLIIQTAFIGDVILATPVVEKVHQYFPHDKIDVLLRKGAESLFDGHPYINKVIVLDKKAPRVPTQARIIAKIKKAKYDKVINLHRFGSSGLITLFSGAKEKIGFDKNPFSFCYTKRVKHIIGNGKHEVERNLELVAAFTDSKVIPPKLYPQPGDYDIIKHYKTGPYICIAPSSVWFTKQFPTNKWIELLDGLSNKYKVYLLGAASDADLCNQIIQSTKNKEVVNLSGKLSFLQSAALMKDAGMNYVNDSAPMHLASAVNAPVTAIYCSTIPAFGFGPLSGKSVIIETEEKLGCRPCGLHGYKACPQGHFLCANTIRVERLLKVLE
jgi:lipopolysaccharide heptosyltransferase II